MATSTAAGIVMKLSNASQIVAAAQDMSQLLHSTDLLIQSVLFRACVLVAPLFVPIRAEVSHNVGNGREQQRRALRQKQAGVQFSGCEITL